MKIIFLRFIALIACIVVTITGAIFLEIFLDFTGMESFKHVIGMTGTILIVISIIYTLRKRKFVFKFGYVKRWLIAHEWLAIIGTGLIFVHGGFHGHALVPLLTTGVMFVTVVSGLTGRYLFLQVSEELMLQKKEMEKRGMAKEEIENALLSLIVAHKLMKHWRTVHIPIVFILALTVTFHILSALYYDGLLK